jgi:hypothetical protein
MADFTQPLEHHLTRKLEYQHIGDGHEASIYVPYIYSTPINTLL